MSFRKPVQHHYNILNWYSIEELLKFFQGEKIDIDIQEMTICETNSDFIIVKRCGTKYPIHNSIWNWMLDNLVKCGVEFYFDIYKYPYRR